MQFRNVKISEHQAIKNLYEEFYGQNYCEVEFGYYKWLHYDNPYHDLAAEGDELTAFGAFDGDRLISCINYVPFRMFIGEQWFKSCWSVGWRVYDDHPGVAGLLLKRQIRNFDFYMSMGATQWVKTIYTTQFGFTYQHNIPRSVMVGDDVVCRDLLARNPELAGQDLSRLGVWADQTRQAAEGAETYSITDFGSLSPRYWTEHRARCRATVSKEPVIMEWRYFRHPAMGYDIISGDANQDSGIAVLRTEAMRDSDVKIVRLVEFMPSRGGEARLAGAVARYLLDRKAAFADFFCGSSPVIGQLPVPFVAGEAHHPYRFPRMFQPLEWRERYSINASFRRASNRADLPEIGLNDVYFTKGDPSQDILLNREYVTKLL